MPVRSTRSVEMVDVQREKEEGEEEGLLASNGSTSSVGHHEGSNNNLTKLHVDSSAFLSRSQKTYILTASLLANVVFISYMLLVPTAWVSTTSKDAGELQQPPHPMVVYGLVHMAKAAGTELNGQLASRYDNVCGNKGYSYDAYQFNMRQRSNGDPNRTHYVRDNTGDMFERLNSEYNRGRVDRNFANEIGFEDCDFISLEQPAKAWIPTAEMFPMELHVPCRDPVDHLMSMCFHRQKTFHCSPTSKLGKEVHKCLLGLNRFAREMSQYKNVRAMKCFQALPTQPYIDYMGKHLIHKRLPVEYVHRESGHSNMFHNRSNDCVYQDPQIMETVRNLLLVYDYFQWCDECIGSDNELKLS